MAGLSGNKGNDGVKGTGAQGLRFFLLIIVAVLLVAVMVLARFSGSSLAASAVISLLTVLAAVGVFSLFAWGVGLIYLSGPSQPESGAFELFDALDEAYAVLENDRLVYANQAYQALFPNGEADIVERLFSRTQEGSEVIYRLAGGANRNTLVTEEVRLSPPLAGEGEFAWYKVQARPLPQAGQNAVLWMVADVTVERQRQENVFRELQHAVNYLDTAPVGFLSVHPTGRILFINATLAGWLGYDLAEVGSGGLSFANIAAGENVSLSVPVSGVPGEVHTETLDIDLRRREGQVFPARFHHCVPFGMDGSPGASHTLVLNRLDTGLSSQVSEKQFTGFFDGTPIAIAMVDRHGGIARANASFIRLFGVTPRVADRGGQQVRDWVHAEHRKKLDSAISAAAEGRSGTQPLELSVAGDGGRSARVWVSAAGANNEDGECAVLYALDTTEFRQVEEQLVQAQKMNAIGQLAGGVAHDFNNVLQAIIGYCDLLLGSHRPTDPSFQDIMQIKQNANRAASLVRQLLAFSRRQTLLPEVLNLSDLLSDLTVFLKRLLGERVELDFRHGRDLWPVLADVHQLEQVMMNLAVNARDAMPEGGRLGIRIENITAAQAAKLAIPGMPSGDYVLIEAADTGTGMPPEVMAKIFEPFFTTKEIGKGTGLGLSTVFGIVQQSGGFMDVRSTVGQGTTFSIYLPRHVAKENTPEEGASVAATPASAASVDMTGQEIILLVEDEDPVRAVNARALTARGYTVLEAASGIEALRIVDERRTPVDLVISDVVMPEMDGPTLLGELRKRHADLKVIFVSGYAEEAFRKHLPEGEDFNFLPKPFGLKKLVETVKQVLRG